MSVDYLTVFAQFKDHGFFAHYEDREFTMDDALAMYANDGFHLVSTAPFATRASGLSGEDDTIATEYTTTVLLLSLKRHRP